jgi:hypothetical protein
VRDRLHLHVAAAVAPHTRTSTASAPESGINLPGARPALERCALDGTLAR